MSYSIEGATAEDIHWIAKFEAEMYSTTDAVPERILKEWYQQNPHGFWVLKREGSRVGHIDILPVKPGPLQNFIAGTITERDIRGCDLYSPEEKDAITCLYIESVAISRSNGNSRALAVHQLLSELLRLLNDISQSSKVTEIFAIAATPAGRRFLKHLGFRLISPSKDRKDEHDLFVTRLSDLTSRIDQNYS